MWKASEVLGVTLAYCPSQVPAPPAAGFFMRPGCLGGRFRIEDPTLTTRGDRRPLGTTARLGPCLPSMPPPLWLASRPSKRALDRCRRRKW